MQLTPGEIAQLAVAFSSTLLALLLAVTLLYQARPGKALEKCRMEAKELREQLLERLDEARKLKTLLKEERRRANELLEEAERRCEKRAEEAARVSRVAQTLLNALEARAITLAGDCSGSIILEPGRILCKEGNTVRILHPEDAEAGEYMVVEPEEEGSVTREVTQEERRRKRRGEA